MNHLWFVIAKSNPTGNIAVVNITHHRPGTRDEDGSCVLVEGDHPFIDRDSDVRYADARTFTPAQQKMMEGAPDAYPPRQKAAREIVEKMRAGAKVSDQTPQKVQKMIDENPLD